MTCPAADVLLAFSTGELPEPRAIEIESHIDECSECRTVLSTLARGGPPPSLGRYRIDTVLGSGGMGVVYRGFDPQLARPVAIKVVRRGGEDSASRQRLVREAQALARLSHPHVCHVYDVGTHDDEVWVAMELIDGVQLRTWAEQGHSHDELMATLLGAADGIAAAHAAGLIHRDIKPENVLVTRDGRAIVTDFGLARHEDVVDVNAPTAASDPQLTATGAIAGTPAYLAPEQLLGDPLDARVDQFAWAVMAWELLTGSRPFPIVFAVRVEAIRAGIKPSPKIPPHINDALAKAMAASPSDRFESMRELIAALKATPVVERKRPLLPTRGRNAAIAGLVVLGGAAVAVTQWPAQKRMERQSANQAKAASKVSTEHSPTPVPGDLGPDGDLAFPRDPGPPPAPQPAPAAATTARVTAAPTNSMPKGRPPKPVASAPTAPAPQQLSAEEPQPQGPVIPAPATPPPGRYCRSCQIAMADSVCVIPNDFEKPGRKSSYGVVDWGTVTKIEDEVGSFGHEQLKAQMVTMRGQRKMYRFTTDIGNDSMVTTKVGALLAICPEGDSDIYQFSGGPTDLPRAVITLSAPPNIAAAARLGAQHINELRLASESGHGALDRLEADKRYLVRAKVLAVDGERYRMDRYYMRVPRGLENEELLVPNQYTWVVVEKPTFEDDPEGNKTLVVTAALVVGELFP